MLSHVWSQGGTRDVYADFNELTLNITTNALFGVDMSSSQARGISGEHTCLLAIAGHHHLHSQLSWCCSGTACCVTRVRIACVHKTLT